VCSCNCCGERLHVFTVTLDTVCSCNCSGERQRRYPRSRWRQPGRVGTRTGSRVTGLTFFAEMAANNNRNQRPRSLSVFYSSVRMSTLASRTDAAVASTGDLRALAQFAHRSNCVWRAGYVCFDRAHVFACWSLEPRPQSPGGLQTLSDDRHRDALVRARAQFPKGSRSLDSCACARRRRRLRFALRASDRWTATQLKSIYYKRKLKIRRKMLHHYQVQVRRLRSLAVGTSTVT
jgi:hypothetical protein